MMIIVVFLLQVNYSWVFYVGLAPVFIAFFAVNVLSHYDNYDPVLLVIKKAFHCSTWCVLLTRRRYFTRLAQLHTSRLFEIGSCEHMHICDSEVL